MSVMAAEGRAASIAMVVRKYLTSDRMMFWSGDYRIPQWLGNDLKRVVDDLLEEIAERNKHAEIRQLAREEAEKVHAEKVAARNFHTLVNDDIDAFMDGKRKARHGGKR